MVTDGRSYLWQPSLAVYLVANEIVCDHVAPETSCPVKTNTSTAGSGFH